MQGEHESRHAAENEVVYFGPKQVAYVPYDKITEVEQVRKTYPQEKIDDLMAAIDVTEGDASESGTAPSFDLYNPILCVKLAPEKAAAYLADHADFFGTTPPDPQTLPQDENGDYIILVSGHRRRRAIKGLLEKYAIPEEDAQVSSNLQQYDTFEEALVAQIRENTHEEVQKDELAKTIEQYYRYLVRENPDKKPTYASIARTTGQSESVVSAALRYTRLPQEIRQYSIGPHRLLSYSTVVMLEPLMRTLEHYYDAEYGRSNNGGNDGSGSGETNGNSAASEDYATQKETYVTNSLHITAQTIIENNLRHGNDAASIIHAQIETLRGAVDFHQGSFFIEEIITMAPERRRHASTRLAKTAITVLELLAHEGVKLDTASIEKIKQVAASLDTTATDTDTDTDATDATGTTNMQPSLLD